MNKLLKLNKLFWSCISLVLACISHAQAMDHSDYCGFMENNLDVYYGQLSSSASHIAENFDSEETKAKKNDLKKTEDKVKDFCKRLEKHLKNIPDNKKYKDFDDEVYRQQDWFVRRNVENYDLYNSRFEKILENNPEFKKEYEELQLEHNKIYDEIKQLEKEQLNKHQNAVKAGEYQPCGDQYPYGCPKGQSCFWEDNLQVSYGSSITGNYGTSGTTKTKRPVCLDPNSKRAKELVAVKQGEETIKTVETTTVGFGSSKTITNEQGKVKVLSGTKITRGDNAKCRIDDMQQQYQSTCYSCKIILTLITSFMNACGKVYDLTREAGSKLLVIGSLFWLAAFSLKLVSAFTNQEPMQIANTLLIFMFKVAAAYIVINVGIGAIVDLFVNPLLGAGADYGLGLLQAANQGIINVPTSSSFPYQGSEIIDSNVINKIMALAEGIDKTVSTNLVIGHALTCHSFNAGMITLVDTEALGVSITLRIPDFWVWLCGAVIWFCGFMLSFGVGYYLLDVCFKIGFCIIALPIVIGLWPFGPTSDKFKACMSIILRSAALFASLALVVSYALSIISASLGDITTFFAKIKANDAEWVANMFSIFSASFIIILFAYLYSIKLVGTATEYTGKFFGDSVFGNASPIHSKATQMTDFVKQKAMQPVKYAGGVVAHQTTRAAVAVAAAPVNYLKNRFSRSKKSSKEDSKEKDKK